MKFKLLWVVALTIPLIAFLRYRLSQDLFLGKTEFSI